MADISLFHFRGAITQQEAKDLGTRIGGWHNEIEANMAEDHKCVEVKEVESFVERCMKAVGTPEDHARSLAKVLVAGDSRGHFSHGLNRLGEFTCGYYS